MLLLALTLAAAPVAVTLDDLPFVGPLKPGDTRDAAIARTTDVITRRKLAVTGFVTCSREGSLDNWRATGVELADHTVNHKSIDKLGLDAFLAEAKSCRDTIAASSKTKEPRYFRYPFLMTGKTAALRDAGEAGIKALGMTIAPVSIDVNDWAFLDAYTKATSEAARNKIADVYVDYVGRAYDRYTALAQKKTGRSDPVKHVILLHANAINADHLDDVLTALTKRGATFIPLEEALKDPVYALADDYAGGIGMSWLYRIAPAEPKSWAEFDDVETNKAAHLPP